MSLRFSKHLLQRTLLKIISYTFSPSPDKKFGFTELSLTRTKQPFPPNQTCYHINQTCYTPTAFPGKTKKNHNILANLGTNKKRIKLPRLCNNCISFSEMSVNWFSQMSVTASFLFPFLNSDVLPPFLPLLHDPVTLFRCWVHLKCFPGSYKKFSRSDHARNACYWRVFSWLPSHRVPLSFSAVVMYSCVTSLPVPKRDALRE